MRIGVLGSYQQVPTSAQSDALVPITSPGGITYGLSKAGDTLICPADYPYDALIKDCRGYAGSVPDVAAQTLQAKMDVCISGGGVWDETYMRCIPAPGSIPTETGSLIPGVPDIALYALAGVLGFMLLTSVMGRR
jgi:hypothetical protein